MKKIAISLVLFALLALTLAAFAQTPQTETTGTSPVATEVVAPDLSKLHPLEKKFFVRRGDQYGWVKEKQDGDVQLIMTQFFSKDASSGEVMAAATYGHEEKEPCVIGWKDGETTTIAIVLKDGKTVTTEKAKTGFEPIKDSNGSIIGTRLFLYSGDDPENRVPGAYREFTLKQ